MNGIQLINKSSQGVGYGLWRTEESLLPVAARFLTRNIAIGVLFYI